MIDVGALFLQLLSSFWWLLPLFVLVSLLKSAWFKGVMGEAMVNLTARLFLDKTEYHLIKNVTIPTEDGTTQIDHIIVSLFGICARPCSLMNSDYSSAVMNLKRLRCL